MAIFTLQRVQLEERQENYRLHRDAFILKEAENNPSQQKSGQRERKANVSAARDWRQVSLIPPQRFCHHVCLLFQ